MSGFFELMKTRRSIRKFTEEAVTEEELEGIFESVRWAPSWANTQCWEVVVVRNPETRGALQATLGERNPATKAVVNAPVLLVLCGRKGTSGCYDGKASTCFGDWMLFDLGIATQNIALAAHAQGLGCVVIGLFDHQKAGEILRTPKGVDVVAMIPLGRPAKVSRAPERKPVSAFCHGEVFGGALRNGAVFPKR